MSDRVMSQAPHQLTDDEKVEALADKARKRLLLLQMLAKRERGAPPSLENNCCVANDEFCFECGQHARKHESVAIQASSHIDKVDIEGGGSISRVSTSRRRAYLLDRTAAGGLLYLERSIDGVDHLFTISRLTDGRALFRTLQK
uniref:Uncharacterized protein n=1 Tax=Plectus sambesii TaxID=2011161 RepID=A0A914WMD6_9BILA